MIDERIVYYLVSIISLNIIMYYLWIWKPDVYFFVFDDSCNDSKTRRNYLLMLIVILCFFLDIVLSEGRQLPAIINESHFFVFDDSCNDSKTRRNYLLMLIVILCFFLDIVLSEGRQLPAIINESHQIVKGTIIKKEEWEKNHKDIVYGKLKIIS